jgi:hypothetical protein
MLYAIVVVETQKQEQDKQQQQQTTHLLPLFVSVIERSCQLGKLASSVSVQKRHASNNFL